MTSEPLGGFSERMSPGVTPVQHPKVGRILGDGHLFRQHFRHHLVAHLADQKNITIDEAEQLIAAKEADGSLTDHLVNEQCRKVGIDPSTILQKIVQFFKDNWLTILQAFAAILGILLLI